MMKEGNDSHSERQRSLQARDHMANERTYLSWLRTAANVMVLGLAIAKFAVTDVSSDITAIAAGVILVAVGALGIVEGTTRYRRVNREIEHGELTTGSRGREPTIAGIVLILTVIVALVLVLI